MAEFGIDMEPMADNNIDTISKHAGAESADIQKDIRQRAEGIPGASNVLGQLAKRGNETYNAVAPKLGSGSEIWEKYKDECGQDLDKLIEKYGG